MFFGFVFETTILLWNKH